MRSQDKIDAINDRLRRCSAQYRAAHEALGVLGPALGRMEWERTLKKLTDEDVRGKPRTTYGDEARQKGKAPTKKQKRTKKKKERPLSWIWIQQGVDPVAGESRALNEGA